MARIRSLKPEFAKDETLAELSREVRLHYALLWTYADDDGRGIDNPKLIKAELWPLDDDVTAAVVQGWQDELEGSGRIVRYEGSGKRLFAIPSFSLHQKPQRPTPSKLAPPPEDEDSRTSPRAITEDSESEQGTLAAVVVGEKEKEGNGVAPAERSRKPDPLFDAFVAEVSYRPSTEKERAAWNGALKQLRDADATAEQVHHACQRYRSEWPEVTLTLPALAKHFGRLVNGNAQPVVSKSMNVAAQWSAT